MLLDRREKRRWVESWISSCVLEYYSPRVDEDPSGKECYRHPSQVTGISIIKNDHLPIIGPTAHQPKGVAFGVQQTCDTTKRGRRSEFSFPPWSTWLCRISVCIGDHKNWGPKRCVPIFIVNRNVLPNPKIPNANSTIAPAGIQDITMSPLIPYHTLDRASVSSQMTQCFPS